MGRYAAFDPVGLNAGAHGHDSARAAAEAVLAQVAAIEIEASALGGVPAVAGFVAAALAARDAQARGCGQERDRRADLAGRVGTTGALGEGLITDTTAIATSVAPDPFPK